MFPRGASAQRNGQNTNVVEIKSKFDAEFRRFSGERSRMSKYEDFQRMLQTLHRLNDTPFIITYIDANSEDLLPINNDENCTRAMNTAKPLLRVIVQRKGESYYEMVGYGVAGGKKKGGLKLVGSPQQVSTTKLPRPALVISMPEDFRRVSSIIDVDILPEQLRRVRLCKHGTERPLGFFIRDGTSIRVGPNGIEKVPGIFISRLIPGGLAESTGLLAVNDEVVEVNGIDVADKSLDQVTDMMIANASNLILTVKPFNQRTCVQRKSKNPNADTSGQYASLSYATQSPMATSTQSLNVSGTNSPLQAATSTQSVNLPLDSRDGAAKHSGNKHATMSAIGETEADARSLDDEDAVRDYTVKSAQPSPAKLPAPQGTTSSTDLSAHPSATASPTASANSNSNHGGAKLNSPDASASPSRQGPVSVARTDGNDSDSEMTI